jgi:hypothetical protein
VKTCERCGEDRPVEDYSAGRNVCKPCRQTADKARRSVRRVLVYPRQLPTRKAGSLTSRVEQAILAEMTDLRASGDLPTTNRFLYYRLIAAGFEKGKTLDGCISDVTTELREAQVIGMDEIADRTRGVLDFIGWGSVAQAAASIAGRRGSTPGAASRR